MPVSPSKSQVFRLPNLTYLVILFLLFGTVPLAFAASGTSSPPARIGLQTVLLVVPLLAAAFVARTATVVDASGLTVRAVLGSRHVPWDDVRGLSVTGRNVYAVVAGGSIRLPCVRVNDLSRMSRASGGRLPALADPTPKAAPSRRRRR